MFRQIRETGRTPDRCRAHRGRFSARTTLLVFGAVTIAGVAGFVFHHMARGGRTNVLLITLDTTRADRLGCYGWKPAETPALDALAGQGTLYANALTPVPLTLPSHATLLTGLLPPEHGLRINGAGRLPADVPTLAERLAARGYLTAAFPASIVLAKGFGLDRGFQTYDDRMQPSADKLDPYSRENPGNVVCDRALDWLAAHARRPFFVWVHFYDPHQPYAPPEPYRGRHADPYDGELAFVDAQVGRLVAFIDGRGLRRRTLIVVAGDHGEAFGEHQEKGHGAMVYNATLRVPLILSQPGRVPAGEVRRQWVSLADLAPTVAAVVGLKDRRMNRGRSLLANGGDERACYGESEMLYREYGWAPLRCLTLTRWKYIDAPEPELYDVLEDPGETRNRVTMEGEVAREMKAKLATLQAAMTTRRAAPVALDAASLRAIQSLGYLAGGGHAPTTEPREPLKDPKAMLYIHTACEEAHWLRAQGQYQEAIRLLTPLLERSPQSATLHLKLYQCYYPLEQWEPAREHIEACLRQWPDDRVLVSNLGTVLLYLGKPDEGRAALERGLRLPQSPLEAVNEHGVSMVALTMHIRLGLAYRRLGRPDDALAQWFGVLKDDPKNAVVHKSAADLLVEQGRFEEATGHYWSAIECGRENPLLDLPVLRRSLVEALGKFMVSSAKAGRSADAMRVAETLRTSARAIEDNALAQAIEDQIKEAPPPRP